MYKMYFILSHLCLSSTKGFLYVIFIKEKHKNSCFFLMSVASWCATCFCVVLCAGFCTGQFVMVPLNLTYLHCLQYSFFEHLFNLYYRPNVMLRIS